MKLAFSKPTSTEQEQATLFSRFRSYGYEGLQLKMSQYEPYISQPEQFIRQWGPETRAIASGLIGAGRLDAANVEHLRALFTFAQRVGAERVIFCHALPRQGLSSAEIKGYARVLSDLGKEARQHGVALSLHHHYNQPVMDRQDMATFFEAVSGEAVKLTVDTAHLVKSGIEDIAAVIRDYRQVIDNIHVKDIANGQFQPPGQGTIDFGPVFAALSEIGYARWLCADEESDTDLLSSLQLCAHFLRAHRKSGRTPFNG
jgi:inosose dehydratase